MPEICLAQEYGVELAADYQTQQFVTKMLWSKSTMPRRPMERGSTMMRPRSRGSGSRRDVDSIMKSLGTLPSILCWKCRHLTSFDLDRCQRCGSALPSDAGRAYRPV